MLYLPIDMLKVGSKLKTDLYFFHSEKVAMLKKGHTITQKFIDRIQNYEPPGVYIKEPEVKTPDPKPVLDDKLKTKALDILKDAFETHDFVPIENMVAVADELVDTITSDKNVFVNIMDLKSYDDYTFHHSISVAVISIAIAKNMNLPHNTLRQLALCALLHDIGKIEVPKVLINKPDKLTRDEYAQVQEHALNGLSYLKEHDINIESIQLGVLAHHERYDGQGYPQRLTGDDIPLFGRIIAIADVFDALTSKRPYRDPMSPADAAEYIMGNSGVAFDHEIVKVFMQTMEFYPPGMFIRLSTGQIAVVLRSEHPLRPIVRLVEKPHKQIDLLNDPKSLSITITDAFQTIPDDVFFSA